MHRGFPLSLLSRFQTFTCKTSRFSLVTGDLVTDKLVVFCRLLWVTATDQRVYSVFVLPDCDKDTVLLQLVEVSYPQLVGLKRCQLQGAGQKPDLSLHM